GRIREILLEGRTDQLLAHGSGKGRHLLVHVSDNPQRIGGHQGVDVGFDERPGIELLVTQLLFQPFLLSAVAGASQDALRLSRSIAEDTRIKAHWDASAVPGNEYQFVS